MTGTTELTVRIGAALEPLDVAGDEQPATALRALVAAHPHERVELTVRDPSAAIEQVAHAAGFEPVYRHVSVRGSLAAVRLPSPRPLTFRRWEEVGRRGVLALLDALWRGRPGPTGLPAAGELERFLDLARGRDGAPDTSLWRVAYRAGEPAGLSLGLALDERSGALLYLGLLEGLRGQRLGAALHAEALWLMRSRGLVRYQDGTAEDNLPMRRIFARAGCEPRGTVVLLVRPAPGGGEPAPKPAVRRLPLGAHVSLLRKVPWGGGVHGFA